MIVNICINFKIKYLTKERFVQLDTKTTLNYKLKI